MLHLFSRFLLSRQGITILLWWLVTNRGSRFLFSHIPWRRLPLLRTSYSYPSYWYYPHLAKQKTSTTYATRGLSAIRQHEISRSTLHTCKPHQIWRVLVSGDRQDWRWSEIGVRGAWCTWCSTTRAAMFRWASLAVVLNIVLRVETADHWERITTQWATQALTKPLSRNII